MEHITELYNDLVERARRVPIADKEAWDDLVQEVVEEYRTEGVISDDEPTEDFEDVLSEKFDEYYQRLLDEGAV